MVVSWNIALREYDMTHRVFNCDDIYRVKAICLMTIPFFSFTFVYDALNLISLWQYLISEMIHCFKSFLMYSKHLLALCIWL